MKDNQTAYILGPISGKPDLNRKSFRDAKAYYERLHAEVISPFDDLAAPKAVIEAERLGLKAVGKPEYMKVMRSLLAQLCTSVDVAYALPGWARSNGALTEIFVCQQIGVPIRLVYTNMSIDRPVSLTVPFRA